MADAGEDPLDALFDKLAKATQNDKHKTALKTVDEILKLAPQDEDAHRVKVSAHMQLEEWENALVAIHRSPVAAGLIFEKAYCQYKLGKIDLALETLKPALSSTASAGSTGQQQQQQPNVVPALELAAQLYYRQDRIQQCIQLYDTLIKKHKVDALDVKTNVLAAYVAAGLTQELPSLMAAMRLTSDSSFEVGYNRACGLVEAGEWAAAESELRRAIKKGREVLLAESAEEGSPMSEAEVEEELAPLTVQLAYVLGRLGRKDEAQELYDQVLRSQEKLEDAPTHAVAINNSFADTGRIDTHPEHKRTVAGAAKKLESLLQDASKPGQTTLLGELEVRLSGGQKQLLTLNRALVYLLAGRLEPARQLAAQLVQAQANAPEPGVSEGIERPSIRGPAPHLLPLLQAALLIKDGKEQEADLQLEQFAAAHPAHALEPTLARAQLALEAGNTQRAAQLLGAATSAVKGPPKGALIATHAALLSQVDDAAGAESVMRGALSSLKASGAHAGVVAWCLEALLGLQLQLGKAQDALATFTQLQQVAGSTLSANATALLSKLLLALASSGAASSLPPAQWSALTKGLPSVAAQVRTAAPDLDALEASCQAASKPPVPASQQHAAAQQQAERQAMEVDEQPAAAGAVKAKKNKKKRKRLPKGYDPSLPSGGLPPPDPERWLPKWQRSDAKKKKLKSSAREKGAVKGSQGAGKVNEELDRTKAAASSTKQPSLPPKPAAKKGRK